MRLSRALIAVSAGLGLGWASSVAPALHSQAYAQSRNGIQIGSPHAVLIEAETGTVLFEKRSDELIAPASLTKLMTVEVVFDRLKQNKLSLTDEFVISENAWRKGGAVSRGSTMYAEIHSRVKIEDLLQGAIIQSGNDATIALAEGIAGTEAGFAKLMNDRARELGLTRSHFTNSSGLPDPKMQVTARELAQLSRHIIRTYPEHYRWYAEQEFTWNKIKQQNRNPLLAMGIGADGLKTGYTQQAGYCLVGSAVQDGMRLIVVIAGAKTPKDRADEARRLLEWGFRSFESRLLFAEGQTIADAKIYGGTQGRVPVVAKGEVKIMVPRTASERLSARMIYTGPVPAPVREGQTIGVLQVKRGDVNVLEVPVHAAESVETGSTSQRAIDAVGELVINLFRSAVNRL
jgi:serine-type D-Ala-D-Ala carboxypeptidase (penicillin-binding protein 5/6)